MKKNILLKATMMMLILGMQAGLYACSVTITNDAKNPVLLVEKEGKYAQMVMPNQTEDIGSSAFHANFYLFEQVNNKFIIRYTVDQASCNLEKHQDITVTEIMNNTGDVAEYFTVTSAAAPTNEKPCCHKDA